MWMINIVIKPSKNEATMTTSITVLPGQLQSTQISPKSTFGDLCKVMVATSAFGAGIDYPRVRLIVHIRRSGSLLDYAQETGRAGRDSGGATCILLTEQAAHERILVTELSSDRPKPAPNTASPYPRTSIKQNIHCKLSYVALKGMVSITRQSPLYRIQMDPSWLKSTICNAP